ncbi:hypothetical protein E8E14_008893 [Neopestalotiopsis sp. 37M]|nr:hypothetical protein E8E14_008893 [Neopestalotiopsis sp. 37M]
MPNYSHLYDMDDNGFLELDDNGELIRLDEHGDPIIGSPVTQTDEQIDHQDEDASAGNTDLDDDSQDVTMVDATQILDDSSDPSDLNDLGNLDDVEMGAPEVEAAESHSASAVEDTTADEGQDGPEHDTDGEQEATPRGGRRSRKGEPRSDKPCPVQGCKVHLRLHNYRLPVPQNAQTVQGSQVSQTDPNAQNGQTIAEGSNSHTGQSGQDVTNESENPTSHAEVDTTSEYTPSETEEDEDDEEQDC